MSATTHRVRRAVLDDLTVLKPLWESMHLPVADLEKRLTEFQVAENSEGKVVGGVGCQIVERYARIHSEAYSDFGIADSIRPHLWERLQAVARNHGITRLWTQEHAPFWKQQGLQIATPEILKKLPPAWGSGESQWLTLSLKDEESIVSLEKEFAMYMQAEKQRTAQTFRHARTLKLVATALAVVLAIFVIYAVILMLRHNSGLTPPR